MLHREARHSCRALLEECGITGLARFGRVLHGLISMKQNLKFPRRRRSACADASLRAELERVGRMTIEERVKAALSMRERFAWIEPTRKTK